MDTAVKQKWVHALRSGTYKQTRYRLKKSDSFDVLGVLCDLLKANVYYWSEFDDFIEPGAIDSINVSVPPLSLLKHVGLVEENDIDITKFEDNLYAWKSGWDVPRDKKWDLRDLMIANDRDYTFEKLADIIEQNF